MDGPLKLPFSDAVVAGGLLFASGQLGTHPEKLELVEGGIGPETEQALRNLGAVLARYGSSYDRVVKCTVLLVSMEDWAAMNEVYRRYFDGPRPPARTAFGVDDLALGARVEIEAVAEVGGVRGVVATPQENRE